MGKRRAGSQDEAKAKAQAQAELEKTAAELEKSAEELAKAAADAKRAAHEESKAPAKGIAKLDPSKAPNKGKDDAKPARVVLPENNLANKVPDLKNGDIVFQKAQKKWDRAVALATGDEWTHTGVIIWTEGAPHVVEITKSLWQEPFDKWRKRGHGHVVVKRLKDIDAKLTEDNDRDFKLGAVRHRSTNYDYGFEWSEDALYSAEFVHVMFKTLGVELGKRTKMRDLQKDATAAAKLEELYGEKIPPDREILSIQSIFDDPKLETVYDSAGAQKAAPGGSRG